jgi:Rne/Rng family ribonuclease
MAASRREILIEEMDGSIWVAALDQGGRLAGLEVDPAGEEVRWGSIYWAKVARIDKAMDAAFISLDGDNVGILHNADVRFRRKNGNIVKGGEKAIGKLLTPGQMIAVQAKTAYMPGPDADDMPAEDKNPRLSMNIALPGRYLIHLPFEDENRVSQRVRDKKLRKQMTAMMDGMVGVTGCILRSAATDMQTEVLEREARMLAGIWGQIQEHFTGEDQGLIMLGPDAVQRALSDQAAHQITRIQVTTMDHIALAQEWCDVFAPDLMTRIEPVELKNAKDEFALFDYRDIIPQIESLLLPYVILPTGATIIIQETAALTAVDVNRGADERRALEINLDCAVEIARQLVLRNMGGAVLIDFLKLGGKAEQQKVIDALEAWFLANDPCTVQVHGMTGLGLLELSRQRRTPPLLERYESTIEA